MLKNICCLIFIPPRTLTNRLVRHEQNSVLAHFQVRLNGSAIRIVDADGSVYRGSLLTTGTNAPLTPAKAAMARAASPPAVQRISFRVAGLNQTLGKNVVFAGGIEVTPAATASASATSGSLVGSVAGGQFPTNGEKPSQTEWLPNARIAGKAVIGRTNQIEINAIPVPP